MGLKDKLNKISVVTAAGMGAILVSGYLTENDALLGFPNAMVLYALMPSALIWFGTRKNGCGSCNQTCTIPEKNDNEINK